MLILIDYVCHSSMSTYNTQNMPNFEGEKPLSWALISTFFTCSEAISLRIINVLVAKSCEKYFLLNKL